MNTFNYLCLRFLRKFGHALVTAYTLIIYFEIVISLSVFAICNIIATVILQVN
jgi:hypothetical protein